MIPGTVIPVRDLTTEDILYGSRETTFRYELLAHNPTTGTDSLIGTLDGVETAGLDWTSGTAVKKSGRMTVVDLEAARPGMLRIRDVNLYTTRIRPVRVIAGLPEEPLGVYVVTESPDKWSGTGRRVEVTFHEKTTVLAQDAVADSFVAPTGTPVLSIVKQVIESAGELISVDGSDTRELSSPQVWDAGTPKLTIVNDLLSVLDYDSLWMDGAGAFRATPYVRPADRSVRYSMLNDAEGNRLVRALSDGERSIYSPEWTRNKDTYKIPNRVVAVAQGDGETAPLSGTAENTDPDSPLSYPSRGRWIVEVLDGVEVPDFSGEVDPDAATIAFLEGKAYAYLIARSQVTATVEVDVLPIPVELGDALIFESTPAGVNARHTVWATSMTLAFDAPMRLELREVVDL